MVEECGGDCEVGVMMKWVDHHKGVGACQMIRPMGHHELQHGVCTGQKVIKSSGFENRCGTQLPEARKEAEVLLAAFVETLSRHYLDAEVENSYYADLSPHYADAPTPWLSALIWYCNQHPLIEAGLSETNPRPLLTLCHGGLSSFCFPPG
ncbi:hypothetical protein L0F63_003679 [Massospora cicadina]|nr:hypothetical protein L0F63_003679 [Massospora cicadina]